MTTKYSSALNYIVIILAWIIFLSLVWGTISYYFYEEIKAFTNWESLPTIASLIEHINAHWWEYIGLAYLTTVIILFVHAIFNQSLPIFGKIIILAIISIPPCPYGYWYIYVYRTKLT
jgi:hypothetical protein